MKLNSVEWIVLISIISVSIIIGYVVAKTIPPAPNLSTEFVAYDKNVGNISKFEYKGRIYLVTKGCILEVR